MRKKGTTKTGVQLITEERARQIRKEGFDAEHDDKHTSGELLRAAICFAAPVKVYEYIDNTVFIFRDPWPDTWDNIWDRRVDPDQPYDDEPLPEPEDYSAGKRVDLLAKAGALIAAEIDRLQRAAK